MGFLSRLFGEGQQRVLEHECFGTIRYSKQDGWLNDRFQLWGHTDIQLLVNAGPEGPTTQQLKAFVRFRDQESKLLPRCLAAVDEVRRGNNVTASEFRISCLSIPSLNGGKSPFLWTIWFDLEGDDHYMYGVQTEDDWQTIIGFADD